MTNATRTLLSLYQETVAAHPSLKTESEIFNRIKKDNRDGIPLPPNPEAFAKAMRRARKAAGLPPLKSSTRGRTGRSVTGPSGQDRTDSD